MEKTIDYYLRRFKQHIDAGYLKARKTLDVKEMRSLNDMNVSVCVLIFECREKAFNKSKVN